MVKARFNPKAPVIVVTPTFVGKNGLKKMINVALDTGATYTMISWEIAENLGYEPALSKDKIDMVTASGVEKAPFITLKGASLLGMKAQNVQTVIHDLPPRSYVDGLLGLSYLRNFKVTLDFHKGMLALE